MEPINTNTNNMEFQEVLDDHLEMIVQDFNEFKERMVESNSSGAIKLEDLIDLFINNGSRENSCSTEHNTLSPHQLQSEHMDGFNMDTQFQESELMVQNTSQNDGGSFLESSKNLGVYSHMGVGNRVTHIRYGDLNCHEAAYGIIGGVFGGSAATDLDSVIRRLRAELGGNGDRTNGRTKVKRKYKEVLETEEETAQCQGMEITKTKKRETPTTAHANRQRPMKPVYKASCNSFVNKMII